MKTSHKGLILTMTISDTREVERTTLKGYEIMNRARKVAKETANATGKSVRINASGICGPYLFDIVAPDMRPLMRT